MHPRIQLASLFALGALTATSAHSQQWSTEALSQGRTNISAVAIGDLALFAGGNVGAAGYAIVDVYDASTGTWSTASLSVGRSSMAATVVGDLALFAGGFLSGGGTFSNVVDIYDASLGAPSDPAAWSTYVLSQGRQGAAATTCGSKAYFAGGQQAFGATSAVVDIYDASLGAPDDPAAWSTATLSRPRAGAVGVSAGGEAIFAGGFVAPGGVPVDDVDICDCATGSWRTAALSEPRILGADGAVAVGGRAYLGGGHSSAMGGPNMSDVVDIYDAQTGAWSSITLTLARGYMGVTAVGNTILFAGGTTPGFARSDLVESYNAGTEQWNLPAQLSEARRGPAAVAVRDRAMFAGGWPSTGVSMIVDIYEPIGVTYCTASPNSTGSAAGIHVTGSNSALASDLVLHGTSLPTNSFGFFLTSQSKGLVVGPGGSQGTLCLGGSIGRYVGPGQVQNAGASGQISLPLDLSLTPTPTGLVAAQMGETWNFQAWYRDVGSVSNFTDAISVRFR